MIVVNLQDKQEYSIEVTRTGENHMVCPVCSHTRKKNKDKCFSFNNEKKAGRCNHCNVVLVEKRDYKPDTKYKFPTWEPKKEILSDEVVNWFKDRKIGVSTLLHFKITEGLEWMPQRNKEVKTIQFNYFENGELANIKYRGQGKIFKMYKDAKLIPYNIDAVIGHKQVIWVEGEMDVLACFEAGIRNVISVPNGATTGRNNLTYLDNVIELFPEDTEFIIATDNDEPGFALRDELVRRLGAENCFKVSFRDCKDANEVLIKHGPSALREAFDTKEAYPVSGIFSAHDIEEEIYNYHKHGLPEGCGIGDADHDNLIKWHEGYLTVLTGIPGHGKSEYLDHIVTKLNILHKWKGAIYSPENYPLQLHFSKFAEKLIGKGFTYMNSAELDLAIKHFDENFFFIKPEEDSKLESILDKAKFLIRKKGIRFLIIDPYNKIEHLYNHGESETQYISRILDQLTIFAQKNNIHIFLVAHPTKIQKDKNTGLFDIPNLYSINGSANFYNKTSVGVTVYKNEQTGRTEIYVQKVKFKHWGTKGMIEWNWDFKTGRYYKYQPDYTNWISPERPQLNMNKFIEPSVPDGTEDAPF